MEQWTLSQIILAFVAVIFIPGIIVHFTLGKNGGHHLFDEELTPEEIKKLPYTMLYFRTKHKLISSSVLAISLLIILTIQRTFCTFIGLSQETNFWVSVTVVTSLLLFFVHNLMYKK